MDGWEDICKTIGVGWMKVKDNVPQGEWISFPDRDKW